MEHPDEGTIHAWLDGALAPERSLDIERHVGECALCAASVAEARGFIAASSRILSALDSVPGGVLPVPAASADGGSAPTDDLAALRAKRDAGAAGVAHRRPWWRHPRLAAAAALAFVAAGSLTAIGLLRNGDDGRVVPAVAPTTLESIAARRAAADSTAVGNVGAGQPRVAEPLAARAPAQPVPERDALARKKESMAEAADTAPPPAPTVVTGATRSDAPRALNEAKAAPVAPLGRASVLVDTAMTNADRAKARSEEREISLTTAPLIGCYATRLVAVGGGPMAIAAVRLPTHIALDSVRVAAGAEVQYEARDVSPEAERTAGTYRWRPTGDRSFDLLIVGENGTQTFAGIVGGNPTATGGPVAPMPAGAPVRLAATRERCR